MYLRPCGSKLGDGFLIASKVGGVLVTVTELEYLLRNDDDGLSASEDLTAVFAFLCALQTISQVIVSAVFTMRLIAAKLAKQKSRLHVSTVTDAIIDDDEPLLLNPNFDDDEAAAEAAAVLPQSEIVSPPSSLQGQEDEMDEKRRSGRKGRRTHGRDEENETACRHPNRTVRGKCVAKACT